MSITKTTSRGRRGALRLLCRRWRQHGEEVDVVAALLGEQAGGRRRARLGNPFEHEVAVGRHVAFGQRDRLRSVGVGRDDRVVEAGDALNREARREIDAHRDRIDLALARMQHRRRDTAGIGHAGRVVGPAAAAVRPIRHQADRVARDVARTDDHGKAQAIGAGVDIDPVLILDFHHDLLARPDVGHRGREDVGPFALHQAGMLTRGGGLLIHLLGLLARLDLADYAPLADFHHQMVDRRLLRQRKHIDALEPGARRIDEVLPHCRPHDRARDRQLDVGPQDRRLIEHAGLVQT